MTETELSIRLRQWAKHNPDRAEEALEKAKAFDEATAGFYGEPQTVSITSFLGSFARARRFWCDVTGESLV